MIIFLILPVLIVLLPVTLILKQPDLGTAAIIISVSFIIFFIAGLSWKLFVSIGFLLPRLLSYLVVTSELSKTENSYPLIQKMIAWIGYHIIQSQIAVGSVNFGKGVDERHSITFRLSS